MTLDSATTGEIVFPENFSIHLIASSLHSGVGDKEKSKSLGRSQPTIATSSISVVARLGLRATSVVLGTFLSLASIFELC